jgi:hypothetical protein
VGAGAHLDSRRDGVADSEREEDLYGHDSIGLTIPLSASSDSTDDGGGGGGSDGAGAAAGNSALAAVDSISCFEHWHEGTEEEVATMPLEQHEKQHESEWRYADRGAEETASGGVIGLTVPMEDASSDNGDQACCHGDTIGLTIPMEEADAGGKVDERVEGEVSSNGGAAATEASPARAASSSALASGPTPCDVAHIEGRVWVPARMLGPWLRRWGRDGAGGAGAGADPDPMAMALMMAAGRLERSPNTDGRSGGEGDGAYVRLADLEPLEGAISGAGRGDSKRRGGSSGGGGVANWRAVATLVYGRALVYAGRRVDPWRLEYLYWEPGRHRAEAEAGAGVRGGLDHDEGGGGRAPCAAAAAAPKPERWSWLLVRGPWRVTPPHPLSLVVALAGGRCLVCARTCAMMVMMTMVMMTMMMTMIMVMMRMMTMVMMMTIMMMTTMMMMMMMMVMGGAGLRGGGAPAWVCRRLHAQAGGGVATTVRTGGGGAGGGCTSSNV